MITSNYINAQPATLQEAAQIIHELNCALRSSGWILALYGSTLKGYGRDIDVIAFNAFQAKYNDAELLRVLECKGWTSPAPKYEGILADAYLLTNETFVIDMQVRRAEMQDKHLGMFKTLF
jgi:hypothetical protein